ncbi:MAG: DUF134 domain-containing protein [Methanomicrobiales archaeon]|nr:DUF134 domain-containing protein [Methanomicrobiales archaeon]
MTTSDENGQCCRRRGRPRINRSLEGGPGGRCYAPQCDSDLNGDIVSLLPEEMAAINLIDLQQMEQEQAAVALGVSRKTIWRDIHEARRKIADALLNGKTIQMASCTRSLEGHCPKRNEKLCPKIGGGLCPRMTDHDQDGSAEKA